MQTIANAATQADYATALQLGPDNFESITAQIFNATCVYSVFVLGGSKDSGTGDWGPELYAVANDQTSTTVNVTRCGGIRFRTNPATPSTVARVNAWAWKDGEPQIAGLTVPGGVLGGSGGLTGATMITGLVGSAGTIVAGTGYSVVRNAAGNYTITYATAFSATPTTAVAIVGGNDLLIRISAQSASAFSVRTLTAAGVDTDTAFNFIAEQTA